MNMHPRGRRGKTGAWAALAALAAAGTLLAPASAQETGTAAAEPKAQAAQHRELIPREVLFGNPDKAAARLSPDGKHIAYIAPVDGVLNIWVAPVDDLAAAKPVTHDTGRGIWSYNWAYTNHHILYRQDTGGDENWKISCINVDKALAGEGEPLDLTPFETIPGPDGKPIERPGGGGLLRPSAQIDTVSEQFPETILVALNNRNPAYHDLYRVNILTGQMSLVMQNDQYASLIADDNYHVRFAVRYDDQGRLVFERPVEPGSTEMEPWTTVELEDAMGTRPLAFDRSGKILYWGDSRGRDTIALFAINTETGEKTLLAEDPRCDLNQILTTPRTGRVQAASFEYERDHWTILDDSIKDDLEYLKTVCDGEIQITSRTLDDTLWTVGYLVDNGPARVYLYNRGGDAKSTRFLYSNRADLEQYSLAHMHPVVITARDGLKLVSYLTLPVDSDTDEDGRPASPLPMVLDVHGGPWVRDSWGFNPQAQWLADRGYAVLQVNYRGSEGFGKAFINAGNREWGGKMSDDLLDAVQWAIEQKIADPDRIAISGGSYGGYATLVGMTRDAATFACGVDTVGVSNLNTFLKTIPPYWKPFLEQMKQRLGDFTTEEGRAFLADRSPVSHVDKITKPLLIGQGANDPRVNVNESEQIVSAMQERNIPVTYVLYPDEGHGFARPPNRLSYNAVVEAFLARHMWGDKVGPFEPIGDDFEGSTITVPAGAEQVPGLSEALGKR